MQPITVVKIGGNVIDNEAALERFLDTSLAFRTIVPTCLWTFVTTHVDIF